MTDEEFKAWMDRRHGAALDLIAALKGADTGPSNEQLAATTPRAMEDIEKASSDHLAAAKKSSHDELMFYISEATKLAAMIGGGAFGGPLGAGVAGAVTG